MNYEPKGTQGNLILFKGSARRKRRRKCGLDKVRMEKASEQQQHKKHRSALRALKKQAAQTTNNFMKLP